jgi:hypothetical protein
MLASGIVLIESAGSAKTKMQEHVGDETVFGV